MRKCLAIFRLVLMQSFAFRAEMLLWIIMDIFPSVILALTWKNIYSGRVMISGVTLSQLLTYYLGILIVINISEAHFEERWAERVRLGQIDHYFTRPVSIPLFIFIEHLARKSIAFMTFVVPFGIFAYALFAAHLISDATITASSLALFVLFLLIGLVVNFMFALSIVLAAFWFDEASSLSHLKWLMGNVFGGIIAPLHFYPQWIQRIADYLPFKRIISIPASLLMGTGAVNVIREFLILSIFAGVTAVFVKVLWKKAALQYTSAGG